MNTVDLLRYHRSLVSDAGRLDGFRRAVTACVKAGDVVMDLGSGTGVLSVLAVRAGARRVYAIEATGIAEIARKVCRDNGVADRVVFLDDLSRRVSLPEPADVLITETIGNFGLDEGILGWVDDARRRCLKTGARIIPQSIELFAAPLDVPDVYHRIVDWSLAQSGLDFSAMRAFAVNNVYRERIVPENFLSEPCSLGTIELDKAPSTAFSATARFEVARSGHLHGIGGWFSSRLCEGVHISNHPRSDPGSWSHFFLPIETALCVEPGDGLDVRISCSGNGSVWRWRLSAASKSREAGAVRSDFDHSTFFGAPGVAGHLHRHAASHAPALNLDGELTRHVLSLMDGARTLEELSEVVADAFPDRFSDAAEALEHLRQMSVTFGA